MTMRAAIGLGLLPLAALAGPFDGIYRQTSGSECALVGVEGGSLRIGDGIFFGVGSQCLMTRPVDVVGMDATLYTMECSADGGDGWTERAMLMQTPEDDGVFMIWNGYAFRYERCPDDTEIMTVELPDGAEPPGDATDTDPEAQADPGTGPEAEAPAEAEAEAEAETETETAEDD